MAGREEQHSRVYTYLLIPSDAVFQLTFQPRRLASMDVELSRRLLRRHIANRRSRRRRRFVSAA